LSNSNFGLLMLLGVIAFIALMYRTRRRSALELARYLRRNGFARCDDVVPRAFLAEDITNIQLFAGRLSSNVEALLLFGRRRGGTLIINNVPVAEIEEYLAIYLPHPDPAPGDDWIAGWDGEPGARGERPQRVMRMPEGGILFNWRCPINRVNIATRLDKIRAVWPGPAEAGRRGAR
jgi:hypothetical protein